MNHEKSRREDYCCLTVAGSRLTEGNRQSRHDREGGHERAAHDALPHGRAYCLDSPD